VDPQCEASAGGPLHLERIDEFAAVLAAEQGKPLAEATAEVRSAAEQFDCYADEARRIYGRVKDGHSRSNRQNPDSTKPGPDQSMNDDDIDWLQRVRLTAAEATSWLQTARTLRQAAEDLWICRKCT
jgi:hypothetical protein